MSRFIVSSVKFCRTHEKANKYLRIDFTTLTQSIVWEKLNKSEKIQIIEELLDAAEENDEVE